MTAIDTLLSGDEAARAQIETHDLRRTLFVEAGAGTGKTRELVERVRNLVVVDGVPITEIAAITFTEAAASELRDRVRESLERQLDEAPDACVRSRCEQALADIDVAPISTLHSFALRILSEHPIDVGLPPRVEVLDEVSSRLAFTRRFAAFIDRLHTDPATADLVLTAYVLGIRFEHNLAASVRDIAAIFDDNWDRLEALAQHDPGPLPAVDVTPLRRAVSQLQVVLGECRDEGDLLYGRGCEVVASASRVLAEPDPRRQLALLDDRISQWKAKGGRAANWPDKVAAQAACNAVGEAATAVCQGAVDAVLRRLAALLARHTHDAADARRAEGRLEFHDILVLARRLVRQSEAARGALHRRYTRLLLDEFQDTDPIQIEIAVLIASAITGQVPDKWSDIKTDDGRLFFVGDPKQSIYRFRRADIGLFLEARDAFGGGEPVRLSRNYRTAQPILEWVNHVFAQVMADEVPGAQAAYQPLIADRDDQPGDHRVVLLGGGLGGMKAAELRNAEAADVARALGSIKHNPGAWPVLDQRDRVWREPRLSDVTVLIPTRTSLRQLEDALDAAGVAYRVDTGTLVYDTQEVRDLLAVLNAVDDPTDEIALVTALRSALYACSDVDLFSWRHAGGRWDLRLDPPSAIDADHPVARGVSHLRELWKARWWSTPSDLVDRVLRDRQAFALGFAHRRPREVWRRLRFVLDQARAFEESGGGGLREFLEWAELQRTEVSGVHQPLLPETDDDAVSIMTIHGSKGLEFPITVVSGVTTRMRSHRAGAEVLWHDDGMPEVKLTKKSTTEHFDHLADLEAEMDVFERRRLLYVACTRARDHLIVCTHHDPNTESYGSWLAEYSADADESLRRRLPVADHSPVETPAPAVERAVEDDRDAWVAAREALLVAQREPRFVSATAIAGETVEAPCDADTDDAPAIAWRRGRAGTAIGRAVHATLQLVDLATGDGMDELAAAQAHTEGVADAAETVAALARSALQSNAVAAALASGRYWRELYVAAPIGGRAIEGYIDLLYETPAGLVIVDYKTDTVRSEAEADEKLPRYSRQMAAYALALEISTGLKPVEAHLIFCAPRGAIERPVTELASGMTSLGNNLGHSRMSVRHGLKEDTMKRTPHPVEKGTR